MRYINLLTYLLYAHMVNSATSLYGRSCVTDCGVASAYSSTEAQEFVDLHNDERRKYGADQYALVSIYLK